MSSKAELRSRLHPLSLPFSMLTHLRGFAIPIILVVLFSKNLEWESWTFLLLVPLLIFEAWRYMSLRFWITKDELVVTEGVLFREERHIPLARIQTVDSTQNLLQRLLGVVEVRVETAGSSKPEAHLKVLSVEARDALRAGIFGRGTDLEADTPPVGIADVAGGENATGIKGVTGVAPLPQDAYKQLHRVGPAELSLLGLNLGRGLALLALFFGLLGQLGLFDEMKLGAGIGLVRDAFSSLAKSGLLAELLFELALAIGLVLLVFALSVGSVWVRLFDFRLERRGDEFRTQCGMFTRHATTIPKGRVQFVSIQAPLSLRMFGRALIKVRTAGGRSEGDKTSATRQWLIPVLAENEVPSLVQEFVPSYAPEDLTWHGIGQKGKRRLVRRAIVTALLINLPLFWFWASWGKYVLCLSLPAVLTLLIALALLRAERLAWAETKSAFLIRDGVLNQRVAVVPSDRLQTASVVSNPLDRRYDMARLFVDTAGAGIGHHASLGYLDRDVARGLAERLIERAEQEGAPPHVTRPACDSPEPLGS